jgi:cytochrome c-type biogenesis protein CcmF
VIGVIGSVALAAGAGCALVAGVVWASAARRPALAAAGRRLTATALCAAAGAVATMEWALLTNDFSVRYVAEHSARVLPVYYRVTALWSALEGSLLLWLLLLAGLGALLAWSVPRRAPELHPWAMATVSGVTGFFFVVALFAGDAFGTLSPVPADGPGPNPLLQDHPLMGVHPPLLYLGFVGLTVPFAYAVAALVTGRVDRDWLAASRTWLLVAWTALTAGIMLGAWWSYEVLGWGGYWAWDPVENASVLPWFTATALLHSVMVARRRPILRAWNLVLAAATFALVLIGTFITRSGVLASVHAFTESLLGPALLAAVATVVGGFAALLAWRAGMLRTDDRITAAVSRESALLVNNVLFVALASTVLLGTTFPLLVEAVSGARVSVGAPYFNRTVVPLALAAVLLLGVGPVLPWGGAGEARRRLRVPAVLGLATLAGLGLAGVPHPLAVLTFGLAVFALSATATEIARSVRRGRAGPDGRRGLLVNRRRIGGLLAHAGIVAAAVAVAASTSYATSAERTLRAGESIGVAGYTAELVGVERTRTDRFMQVAARMRLSADGAVLAEPTPQLRFYPAMTEAIGRPAVRSGPTEDAYLTVSAVSADGSTATVRLTVTPLMLLLWLSGALTVLGGVVAAWPRSWPWTRPAPRPSDPRDAATGPVEPAVPAGMVSP